MRNVTVSVNIEFDLIANEEDFEDRTEKEIGELVISGMVKEFQPHLPSVLVAWNQAIRASPDTGSIAISDIRLNSV